MNRSTRARLAAFKAGWAAMESGREPGPRGRAAMEEVLRS